MTALAHENDFVGEIHNALDALACVLELENEAVVARNMAVLKETIASKQRLNAYMRRLWSRHMEWSRENQADPLGCSEALEEKFIAVKRALEENARLLVAMKIATANKIEAGIQDFQRSQNFAPANYDENGEAPSGLPSTGLTRARLI